MDKTANKQRIPYDQMLSLWQMSWSSLISAGKKYGIGIWENEVTSNFRKEKVTQLAIYMCIYVYIYVYIFPHNAEKMLG